MKSPPSALLFYAAATFLLGVIAYAVLTPLVETEGVVTTLAGGSGLGFNGWLRILSVGVMIGAPVLFGVAAASGDEDRSLTVQFGRTAAVVVLILVVLAGGLVLANLTR